MRVFVNSYKIKIPVQKWSKTDHFINVAVLYGNNKFMIFFLKTIAFFLHTVI